METYRITVSPAIAAVPLFTLAGYVLAEGGASRRIVRLFHALLGWLPGGVAIVTVLVCAFFTTFTGASGVTIIALGGLMLPGLLQAGYRERYALGLITSCGSLGLLFPPSLPVILYGVVAHAPILDLFIAGAVPGALMVAFVGASGVYEGWHSAFLPPTGSTNRCSRFTGIRCPSLFRSHRRAHADRNRMLPGLPGYLLPGGKNIAIG